MAFKRALWHSGLTYKLTCNKCQTVIQYTDDKLDFRPWYADGFVYCPKCRTPLRHNESFAIDENGNYINTAPAAAPAATAMIMITPSTIDKMRPMIPVILPTFVNVF